MEANGAPAGPAMTFTSKVTVNTGAGDDTITIGVAGEAGNSAHFDARVVWDGGAGTDVMHLPIGSTGIDADDLRNIESVL